MHVRKKYKLGHKMHAFTDRRTNKATECMDSQTEEWSGHHTYRQKYKTGHHMHAFTDKSTNQARPVIQEIPMNYQYLALVESADEASRAGVCKVR